MKEKVDSNMSNTFGHGDEEKDEDEDDDDEEEEDNHPHPVHRLHRCWQVPAIRSLLVEKGRSEALCSQ